MHMVVKSKVSPSEEEADASSRSSLFLQPMSVSLFWLIQVLPSLKLSTFITSLLKWYSEVGIKNGSEEVVGLICFVEDDEARELEKGNSFVLHLYLSSFSFPSCF